MLNGETIKHELKRSKKYKTKQENPRESPKLELIFQTHNPWNHRPRFNQEVQFPTNLLLNDKIQKKILI